MRELIRTLGLLGLTITLTVVSFHGCASPGGAVPAGDGKYWFRGNTHTHTLWSDGNAAPDWVTDWYKSNGYHFLVLSDHNVLADGERWVKVGKGRGLVSPKHLEDLKKKFGAQVAVRGEDEGTEFRLKTLEELREQFDERGRFIMITGEEITDKVDGKPVHHNSINQYHLIRPPGGKTVREAMQRAIELVEAESFRTGRPVLIHLNHPNFHYAVTPDDLAYVTGERYFEVYNGHRGVRNYGDETHMSTEKMWDYVLSMRLGVLEGPPLYGLATDDAHNYHGTGETANPGRGWVMVRAEELTPAAITQAMIDGDFYASSGVMIRDVSTEGGALTVSILEEEGVTYTTRFIGTRTAGKKTFGELKVGEVLEEVSGPTARYAFKGDELYVRALVVSSKPHPNGYSPDDRQSAWTQPVPAK